MLFHRVFAMMNEEIIGAVLFISVFSAGVMYYFFSLFRKREVEEGEYLISMFFQTPSISPRRP